MAIAQKTLVTYEALSADVLSNGDGRPVALVILAEGDQRVLIRLDRRSLSRLQARIDATLAPDRLFPTLG